MILGADGRSSTHITHRLNEVQAIADRAVVIRDGALREREGALDVDGLRIHVSDRIAVMHEGRITGVVEGADRTEERIMALAVGQMAASRIACGRHVRYAHTAPDPQR